MARSLSVMAAASLLLLPACGARTGVGEADASPGRDAGAPLDGGPDAGSRDGGASPLRDGRTPPFDGRMPLLDAGSPSFDGGVGPCDELVPLTHSMVVHEDVDGPLTAPGAMLHGSTGGSSFHLLATFSPSVADRAAEVRIRQLTLEPRAAVMGEVVVLKGTPLVPATGESGGAGVGVATTVAGATGAEARLAVYAPPAYAELRDEAVAEGRVFDLVFSGESWLLALHQEQPRVLLLTLGGAVRSSWPALPPGSPDGAGEVIRATRTGGGFAWASPSIEATGNFPVAFLRDGLLDRVTIGGVRPRPGDSRTPAIAPSRWPPHGVVVAAYDRGQLLAAGVDRDGQQWRTEGLTEAESAPTAPAVVTGNFGVVVAGMQFGGSDTSRGRLELMHLSDEGTLRGDTLSFEARRAEGDPTVGLDAATDATNVVVHYTSFDAGRRAWQTRAMVFRCIAT